MPQLVISARFRGFGSGHPPKLEASQLNWLLGTTASPAVLVSGIAMMNIMLVSVTVRTREIGSLASGATMGVFSFNF